MNISKIENLCKNLWDIELEWLNIEAGENADWPVERHCKYNFGPVIGMYREKNEGLLDIISDVYTDNDIYNVVKFEINRQLDSLENKEHLDVMDKNFLESYQNQILLLECGEIETWLQDYFYRNMTDFEIEFQHLRGVCYIYYAYLNYINKDNSLYSHDISNLKKLYQGIYGKESQLYTYDLLEITPECQLLAINPPRFYDSRIDKTICLVNVSKELLEIFSIFKKKALYNRLSIRGSNSYKDIFDGKYELETMEEALEIGKFFSLDNFENIPITKLYSKEYKDCLWITVNSKEITFEELCEKENRFDDAIITQVVHLEYILKNSEILITHIDHEFIFYDQISYEERRVNSKKRGKQLPKLKSFKIDEAQIPINILCTHNVNVYDAASNSFSVSAEKVPFLIFVLKSYFKHTDLIDEYFQNWKIE